MSWNSVVGQNRVKAILRTAIQRDRLAHAYLLSGMEGGGMDAIALELAKIVNCSRGGDEACDECASCRSIGEGRHPNVHLITALPVGKGEKKGDDPLSKLSDEEVEFIREQLGRKSGDPYRRVEIPKATSIKINSIRQIRLESSRSMFAGGKRVFILLAAEMLNDEAGNALLKILEEPHDGTMLLLTTAHPMQLLPTILSRCQHIQCDPVSAGEIAEALERREGLSRDDAAPLAGVSGGSYGRALESSGPAVRARRNDAVEFLRVSLYKPGQKLLDEIDRLQSAYDRGGIVELLTILEAWLRDAQCVSEGFATMQAGDDLETVKRFAANHGNLRYERIFASLSRAVSLLGKNVYIPLVLITLALALREDIVTPSEQ